MLSEELPVTEQAHPHRGPVRHVPAVKAGPPHPLITTRSQYAMKLQIERIIFDEDKAGPPSGERQSIQDIDFVALDVNRKEVDRNRCVCLYKYVIEGS